MRGTFHRRLYKSQMLITNRMPLHDTLSRLMLTVDRVGSRLGCSSEGGDYAISDYTPSGQFEWFYPLHQANVNADYAIVLRDNGDFRINRGFARMLSKLIDIKNCRWTGRDDSRFDMHDVTQAEFVSLVNLTCGKTKAVRAGCIVRYIEITLKYFFPESLHQALIEAYLTGMQTEVDAVRRDVQLERTLIDDKHEELLKKVQPVVPLPRLYLYSRVCIQDKAQLHTGHYYGYLKDGERGPVHPVLFLGSVFNNGSLVYIGVDGKVSRAYISELFHLLSFDEIRPNGMMPSAGYFTRDQFNRHNDGECLGEYFECDSAHLYKSGNHYYASRQIMVWLLGYDGPDTACVSYDDKAWYIPIEHLSLVKPELLSAAEHAEQIERSTLIASSALRLQDVECSPGPVANRADLTKGKVYGCLNQLFAAVGQDGTSRTFGYTHFVSVLYLGPCLKDATGVYIYHNHQEYLFGVQNLHEVIPAY